MHYSLLNVPGIERLSPWFLWRLASACAATGRSADCILAMMHVESGMKADAINPMSGASGLVQVMPSMAGHYGLSIEEIRGMGAEEQLERIILKKTWPKTLDCGVVYLANFLPAYLTSPDDTVLGDKSGKAGSLKGGLSTKKVYEQNYGFDTDKDGIFTVGDVKNFLRGKVQAWADKRGYIEIAAEEPARESVSADDTISMAVIAAGIGGLVVLLRKAFAR